jgi:hypothetical protein
MHTVSSGSGYPSISFGKVVHQSLQIINCSFAASQIDKELKGNGGLPGARPPIYAHTGSPNDFSVIEGELVFALSSDTGGVGNIPVRSALNGVPSTGATQEAQIAALMDKLVVVGFAGKTSVASQKALSLTEAPVALVGGQISAPNVTQEEWYTGDILIWTLPHPNRSSTQAPIDGSIQVTAQRRVIEPVPLRCLMRPFVEGNVTPEQFKRVVPMDKLQSFTKSGALHRFIRCIVFHALVHQRYITQIEFNAGDLPAQNVLRAERLLTFLQFNGALPADRGAMYGRGPLLTAARVVADIASADAIANSMIELLDRGINEPTFAAADIMTSLLGLTPLTTSLLSSREVARVLKGARPGFDGDISITFGSYNMGAAHFQEAPRGAI